MLQGWLSGWKEIAAYCGNINIRTAKRYYKQFGLPVRYLPSGTPVAMPDELRQWLVEVDTKKKNRRGNLKRMKSASK